MPTHQVHHRFDRQAVSVNYLDSPARAAQVHPTTPRRGLDVHSPEVREIEPPLSEEALLELIGQFCIEECRRHFAHVKLRSYQEMDPTAVSQIHPPERCWFVRVSVSPQEASRTEPETQVIVSLSESALHLLFR